MATQSEAKPQSSIQEGIEGSDIKVFNAILQQQAHSWTPKGLHIKIKCAGHVTT